MSEPRPQAVRTIAASSTTALVFDADEVQGKFAVLLDDIATLSSQVRSPSLTTLADRIDPAFQRFDIGLEF